ncbi:sulfurtransferase [Halorussus salilacus]|uniref:sulfurtransferase n=1 Tax=Halorussus salilacus TaxID=2953750 RepID=UPI00209CD262|nr:sulfurtransferase [Halorussus salilacus]USZ67051.1 sulfurtransferase [Halorussus salilacus]
MNENVVVSAEWLAERLDEVRVVDVREAWEYDGIGHVPGAVNIPFEEFRSASDEESAEPRSAETSSGQVPRDAGMLPGEQRWADLLGDAGISADDTVVAYDDTHGVFAARFLVTAELYGHEDLRLLDGDYSSWMRERETSTEAPTVEPTTYETREPTDSPLVDRERVESAVDDPDAVLVDTREDWEFAEGHIPGAVNLDWRELVDDETRGLKPRAELESILESHAIIPDKRIVLYCNTARRISHTYVVLSWLGYPNLEFYEGSLTEWEDAGGAIETGE